MTTTMLFEQLWDDYTAITPSALKVKQLFESKGSTIYNDHVAFRTYNDPRVNIDVLSKLLIEIGYEYKADYHFEEKKLYAKHFEHPTAVNAPLVFISELLVDAFSNWTQKTIKQVIDSIDFETLNERDILFSGRLWELPSFDTYSKLLEESEYAAWLYVNGFCANHFTVDINKLEGFDSLKEVNEFLKQNGFKLNTSGGEIKGNPQELLEQSSIMADKIEVQFQEGSQLITSCYYEFAYRYPQNNELFKGFISSSADKIFESTDMVVN